MYTSQIIRSQEQNWDHMKKAWHGGLMGMVASLQDDCVNHISWYSHPYEVLSQTITWLTCETKQIQKWRCVTSEKRLCTLSWVQVLSWITHSGKRQQPPHEQPLGEAHRRRNWGLMSTAKWENLDSISQVFRGCKPDKSLTTTSGETLRLNYPTGF